MNNNRHFKFLIAILVVLILVSFLPSHSVFAQDNKGANGSEKARLIEPKGGKILPDQYIVVYKSGISAISTASSIKSQVAAAGGKIKRVYSKALNGFSAYLSQNALEALLADPNVAYIAEDAEISLDDVSAQTNQKSPPWGLDRIDQHVLPLNSLYIYYNTGSSTNLDVDVYIIDTGINASHVEFGGRASKDFDAIGDGQNGNDCNGHGTHVAGIIGGTTYGVAKGVKLHAVRVLNCSGSGSYSDVIAGIDWVAANHQHPAVANLSLTGNGYQPLDDAINKLIASEVTTVVAAGNSSTDACYYSPARVPGAITVGATTSLDARAYYSNYGSCVDLFAPGSNITSAWIGSNTALNTISGTSMAAPHVAGVAALYLQYHPSVAPRTVANAILNSTTNGLLADVGTSSPNKLLYSMINGIETRLPVQVSPSGTITENRPTYTWGKVKNATKYEIQVYTGPSTLLDDFEVPASACSGYYCSFRQQIPLDTIPYKWRIRSYVGSGWSGYTSFMYFNIVSAQAGFFSDFSTNYDNWSIVSGPWGLAGGSFFRSWGTLNNSDSAVHSENYPNLDYSVEMKRVLAADDPNRIIIYGIPNPLSTDSLWNQGLVFEYTNSQNFRIYRTVAGVDTILVNWKSSSYINAYGYNKLRIIAKGGIEKFYINDHLVAGIYDSTLSTGQVGFGFTQTVSNSPLYVNFARVITTVGSISSTSFPDGVATYGFPSDIPSGANAIDQSE